MTGNIFIAQRPRVPFRIKPAKALKMAVPMMARTTGKVSPRVWTRKRAGRAGFPESHSPIISPDDLRYDRDQAASR